MSDEINNINDFNRLYHQRIRFFGEGVFETGMSVPCPFCAAPDFMTYKVMEVEQAMTQEHVCRVCHRGCRAIFKYGQGGKEFELVQTRGDDPPAFLPKMRRDVSPDGSDTPRSRNPE